MRKQSFKLLLVQDSVECFAVISLSKRQVNKCFSVLSMNRELIDVIKLQQTYLRIRDNEDFFIHRDYVISVCIVLLKNSKVDITWEQLRNQTPETPEIKWKYLYKRCKIYRLYCIIQEAQKVIQTFLDAAECPDKRSRMEKLWRGSILPIWSILKLKFSQQAHWYNDLQC